MTVCFSGAFSEPDVLFTPDRDSPLPGPSHDCRYTRYNSVGEVGVDAGSLEQLKEVNQRAESTRSLSYLEWVHERQTKRMISRSQWSVSFALSSV